ncbi:MAG: hypothetical protein M1835_001140 [Candelina submexicana]|nr:MAG: hypothetical protein M1835_001140 [Candelina submexicana]
MAPHKTQADTESTGRLFSVLKSLDKQAKQSHRIAQKELLKPVRKSTHLENLYRQLGSQEQTYSVPSPSTSNNPDEKSLQDPSALAKSSGLTRKRKRGNEYSHLCGFSQTKDEPTGKRPRTSPTSCAVGDISNQKVRSDINNDTHPIKYWIQEGRWPREYFEQDSQLRKYLRQKSSFEEVKHEDWFKEQFEAFKHEDWFKEEYGQMSSMSHLLARPKPSPSLRRKNSDSSIATPSDQQPREAKSAKYRTTAYSTLLATKGSFMDESDWGITDASKILYQMLLNSEQTVPQDSLFRDDLFKKTCRRIQDRNEAMVIRDITLLIVPSAQTLATYGATHPDHLMESVNEGWNSAIPFYGPRPQPDYSVGFGRSAFTDDQLEKLTPFVGEIEDSFTSYFMATWQMYLPFLTCEVKCGAKALDVADRQNAHSMTLAVRGVIELFRLVKREKELHREILAFSISHDHRTVRIYGHYALIDEDKTTFYRHPIREFSFTEQDGKEKWTAYTFTKNVYDIWMPTHLKRICSAIDEIPPEIDFGLSQSASFAEGLDLQNSQQSNAEPISELEVDDSLVDSQDNTPNTSFTQSTERQFKKPRNKRAAEQQS